VSVKARYALPKLEIEIEGLVAPVNTAAGAPTGVADVAA
jgi:hypothetical protein